jgi:hypothetical protein
MQTRPTLQQEDCGHWLLLMNLTSESDKRYSIRIAHSYGEDIIFRRVEFTGQDGTYHGITRAQRDLLVEQMMQYEDILKEDALATVSNNTILLSDTEEDMFRELERYWDAIKLLVRPAVTPLGRLTMFRV